MYKLSKITRINMLKEDGSYELMTWSDADAYIRKHNPLWYDLANVLGESISETVWKDATTMVLKGEKFLPAIWRMATATNDLKGEDLEIAKENGLPFIQMVDGYVPHDILESEVDVLPGQIAYGAEFTRLKIAELEAELKRLEAED